MFQPVERVVWVLGSGFSVPLGGPTLRDLFGQEGQQDLSEVYRDDPDALVATTTGPDARNARKLFHYGRRYEYGYQGTGSGELLWEDAEAFLDVLETAALSPIGPEARRLEKVVRGFDMYTSPAPLVSVSGLRDAARRMLAVECARFLYFQDVRSERWDPYHQWIKLLSDPHPRVQHTLVTFNYDLVLEKAGLGGRVLVPPSDPQEPEEYDDGPDHLVVLKMHGSVDWRRTVTASNKSEITRANDEHFVAKCPAAELAIAPPGPEKAAIAKQSFGKIWRRAEEALAAATAVVFIGYRFPPSDARSRARLLNAMPDGGLVHVVLGADVHSPDVLRMGALLRSNRPTSTVKVHPLFSQDFMTVWTGRSLSDPDRWP